MDIREEILDYINRIELPGALLLTGQWGCGKSYLVKEIAKEQNSQKKAALAVISLFGLDSVDAINKRVKEEYTSFMLGSFGKSVKKISKALTTVAKDGMTVASMASAGNPGLSAASHGLSSILNYDLFGFVEVQNTIGKDENKRRFVLVFDDLERNNLTTKDLLGTINEYVENKQIKVIIVADEDKIANEEYIEYKVKLISRTIRMSNDYDSLIECIINQYTETSKNYKSFLIQNLGIIKQVFAESKSNNLRTLKAVFADFERVYDAWIKTDVPRENMGWALYTFTAEVFKSKETKKEEKATEKKNASFFFEKKEEKYTDKGRHGSSFLSLSGWIYSGMWDKDAFIKELKGKYGKMEETPLDRFLLSKYWGLEQQDINEGLPTAVTLAYEGKLPRNELIYLITKVHFLKSYSIKLPCEVNYEMIETGFMKRIEGIKNGTIIEPKCHTFAEDHQLDPEARHLYTMIDKMDDKMYAWNHRSALIAYFRGDSSEPRYRIRGLSIEEFDDELLYIFEECYNNADNYDKQDYANMLLSMVYDNEEYSSEDNILTTKRNFERLVEWLSLFESDDAITALINKLFIKEIHKQKLMDMN